MDEFKRSQFQVMDGEGEYDNDRRKFRLRIIAGIVALLAVVIIACVVMYVLDKGKTYSKYEVVEKIKIDPVSDAEFYEFDGGILKISKNGAIYTQSNGQLIWNQSFQMNVPIVDICEDYVAIGAKKGTEIYILDTEGLKGKIETTKQIREVEVASQGTVAVITEKKDSYYINMYAVNGEELVQGEMHIENSGYPLAMSLSSDAIKLAVSLVDVSKGQANTTLNFYNFGSVGQNEIDNLVRSYTYENVVIPKVHYFDDEYVVAIGDNRLLFYQGTQKPELEDEIAVDGQIRSVFYSDKYVGYTTMIEEKKETKDKKVNTTLAKKLLVYDRKGSETISVNYKNDYTKIRMLDNDGVVLTLDSKCLIYNMSGVVKYDGELDDAILALEPSGSGNEYYVLYKDRIERIKFK